jgi:osmoprotectant transport system permease protein
VTLVRIGVPSWAPGFGPSGLPLRSPDTLITALGVYGVALLARTAADAFDAAGNYAESATSPTGG